MLHHTRRGLFNTTPAPPTHNPLDFTTIATPFLANKAMAMATTHILQRLNRMQTRFPWRPPCVSQKLQWPHCCDWHAALCACRVRPLSLCLCLQCWGHGQQVPTTDSVSQLLIKKNTQWLQFAATIQSRGEKYWLLALPSIHPCHQSVHQSQVQNYRLKQT